jgi:diaminopimelate decarboxylase
VTRNHRLVARFGTPIYIYELDRVVAAYRDLRNSLPPGVIIYYSLKANPHPDIARVLRQAERWPSCRAEVSSVGELYMALEAGFPAGECLYTGPGKTEDELITAIAAGVHMFSVESLTDLIRAGSVALRMGTVADCLLRINSVSAGAATSIRMMGKPSQFGIDSETLEILLPRMREVRGTRLVGAHFYSQSNARDEASLLGELQQSVITAARLQADFGLPMQILDIGGGFAAPYAVPGERPLYRRLRVELGGTLDKHFGRLMPLAVKPDERYGTDDMDTATLVGPLCTPGDVLSRNVQLHTLRTGDIVTVPNVGAYGLTASLLLFLSRPAPHEVVLRGGQVLNVSQLRMHRTADHDPHTFEWGNH